MTGRMIESGAPVQNAWFRSRVDQSLAKRREEGLYREPRTVGASTAGRIIVGGRELLNFGSNDYLALASHPAVAAAARNVAAGEDASGIGRWGAGAAPLLTGRSEHHAKLEADLADWKRAGGALSFSSGYAAGVSVIPALATAGDTIFSDALNHASLIDGCRLSRATIRIYPHCDYDALRTMLAVGRRQRRAGEGFWILTDSVFSMEGDCVSMPEVARLAAEFDAGVIVDEAHAGGVFGSEGVGLAEPGLLGGVPLVAIGTLSKALGSVGGFVVAESATIDYLRNFARGYIYSTAMPAAAAAAGSAAVAICRTAEGRRAELRALAAELRRNLVEAGWSTTGEDSPIVPVYTGTAAAAAELSTALRDRGFWAPPIRPPTVPAGRSLLRISLTAAHSRGDVAGLVATFADLRGSNASL